MDIKLENILRERISNRENSRQLAEEYAALVVEENAIIIRNNHPKANPALLKRVAEDEVKFLAAKRTKTDFSLKILTHLDSCLRLILLMDGMDTLLLLKRTDCLELGLLTKNNIRDFTWKLSDTQRSEIVAWGNNLSSGRFRKDAAFVLLDDSISYCF
jgi:hypothetical protein